MGPDVMTRSTKRDRGGPEGRWGPPHGTRLFFIGVATSGSSIMHLFPRWAQILGIEATIEGRDIPLGADAGAYRATVEEMARDSTVAGALVTSHKVDVYRHASDLFVELDDFALLCKEISCVSKRDDRLVGHAKDPVTAGKAMEFILGPDPWKDNNAHVLCLGAGGAGTAITVQLLSEIHPPTRVVVTDKDPTRIARLRGICQRLGAARAKPLATRNPEDVDSLLTDLPPGSLVVNATGIGKDVPGSPLSDAAEFPHEAAIWDLNYRGDLTFLRQARARAEERNLRVHDGWRYFLHGWSEVIAEVFDLELFPGLIAHLAEAAEPFRP